MAGVCAVLVAMVALVFGRTAGFGFVNFDDGGYVYENPIVLKGLSWAGIGWAFTHVVAGHWHPLTVIVILIEHQFFGLRAGGYHVVNVLLHAASVVMLFLLFIRMTGRLWESAVVAALFAVHPLRVESVAWISECKDVLSGFFFMLTLWAYVSYARGPSRGRYAMVLAWFALGLLSKPMLVTVPCVLLLLDYWPLGRLRDGSQFRKLILEKLPLFGLSALSSIAAVVALRAGTDPISSYPANAPIAYVDYLSKFFDPANLAVLYPLPKGGSPAWEVAGAILLLIVITAGAWSVRPRYPFLLAGWLWFVGMLVPVIGIMQTSNDAFADRYTYLPEIGLCFGLVWLVSAWAGERNGRRIAAACLAAVIVCALMVAAWRQVGYWHDSIGLWEHTLESTRDNSLAHYNLGDAEAKLGETDQAIAEFREVLRLDPRDSGAHYSLGRTLLDEGRTNEAIAEFEAALQISPHYAEARYNLGYVLLRQGRIEDAIAQFHIVLQENPTFAEGWFGLGYALLIEGRMDEAVAAYRQAVRADPDYFEAQDSLGKLLLQQGDVAGAIGAYQAAVQIEPTNGKVENILAWMLATAPEQNLRDGRRALELATRAAQSTGGSDPAVLRTLAAAYAETGDFASALQTAQRALSLAPAGSVLAEGLRTDIASYQAGHQL